MLLSWIFIPLLALTTGQVGINLVGPTPYFLSFQLSYYVYLTFIWNFNDSMMKSLSISLCPHQGFGGCWGFHDGYIKLRGHPWVHNFSCYSILHKFTKFQLSSMIRSMSRTILSLLTLFDTAYLKEKIRWGWGWFSPPPHINCIAGERKSNLI